VKTIAGFTLGSLITAILLITYASYETLRSIDRD
jgi:hypothetical protein